MAKETSSRMNETVINVEKLSCFAGKECILSNITWQVNKGEKWVVFGKNGCGKTTLLSIIAGYKSFAKGKLEVFGQEYTADNILQLRRKIGWISSSFFDKYYTKEMALDIVLAGYTKTLSLSEAIPAEVYRRAQELLRELGLKEKIYMPFDALSKGERQNVLLAREFIRLPEILILDEPGTGLDVMAREYLLSTLQVLAEDKEITIIYVTHYPEEILPVFDKTLLLRCGAVYKEGPTQELLQSAVMSDYWEYPVEMIYNNGRPNFFAQTQAFSKLLRSKEAEGC